VAVLETSSPGQAGKPERLGAYELLLELAAGGMATVHLARAVDKRLGPPLVAVKRPHRHLVGDKTFLTMLVDEARLASSIRHPNVVRVRELGFDGGMPFIVMDYIEGTSLAELRRELSGIGRTIDVRVAVRMVLDALSGLHAAHELKDDNGKPLHIIHRDVSPHNVLVGCDGRSLLTDFGIAKAEDRVQTTRTHEVKGKLAYLAPERIDKRRICTVQSDVFSMAVVLWECFAGRRLFRGEEAVDILQEVLSAPIPTLRQIGAQVPPALDDVIARALSRDLETRYATAAELAEALERAAGPNHVGTEFDVARLMEAVFGPRMAQRQDHVRAAVGPSELTDLLRESGLPTRDRDSIVDGPAPQLLAELAPPAPTGRYALGTEMRAELAKLRPRRVPWIGVGTAAAGVVIGVAATLAFVSGRSRPAPIVVRGATEIASAPLIEIPPATHKVVVPLPFIATHVAFDETARDLDPASDSATFDVPAGADPRHHVTIVAIDGTTADGNVREQDGIARPDGMPLTFTLPSSPADSHAPVLRASRPVGTVRNGFTKLR
jgi:eukaryotic-like serine/threonine-protein kinase